MCQYSYSSSYKNFVDMAACRGEIVWQSMGRVMVVGHRVGQLDVVGGSLVGGTGPNLRGGILMLDSFDMVADQGTQCVQIIDVKFGQVNQAKKKAFRTGHTVKTGELLVGWV